MQKANMHSNIIPLNIYYILLPGQLYGFRIDCKIYVFPPEHCCTSEVNENEKFIYNSCWTYLQGHQNKWWIALFWMIEKLWYDNLEEFEEQDKI